MGMNLRCQVALLLVACTCTAFRALNISISSTTTNTVSGIIPGFALAAESTKTTPRNKKSSGSEEEAPPPPRRGAQANIPKQEHESCLSVNSEAWLQGPRVGNIAAPYHHDVFLLGRPHAVVLDKENGNEKYFQQKASPSNTTTESWLSSSSLSSSLLLTDAALQPALRQTLCHDRSAFFNESDGYEQEDLHSSWTMRLLYLAMHYHQHRAAQTEARQRLTAGGERNNIPAACLADMDRHKIGSFDYECPHAKFIVASLPNHGLGSVMRVDAVRFLLAGLALDRVVVFVNGIIPAGTGTNSSGIPKPIRNSWSLASCGRKDYQCFFQPLSPCTLTVTQIKQATIVNTGQLNNALAVSSSKRKKRNGSLLALDKARVWILDLENVPKPVPPRAPAKLRALALELINDYAATMASSSSSAQQRVTLLRQAAQRIMQNPDGKNGDDVDYSGSGSLIKRAALLYTMRPNDVNAARLATLGQRLNSNAGASASQQRHVVLGLPIRASDKCHKESECLSFEQYMRMLGELWNRKVLSAPNHDDDQATTISTNVTIVLTSESTQIIRDKQAFLKDSALVKRSLPFANSFQFVTNDGDVRQGTGNSRHFGKLSADDVMLSTFTALQAQLLPEYVVGNCCSHFHNMMFDFLRAGCGVVKDVFTQCMQRAPNPEFWICCWPKQQKRCLRVRKKALQTRQSQQEAASNNASLALLISTTTR